MIPNLNRVRETRYSNNIPAIHTRHNYFKNLFFSCTISEWSNLHFKIAGILRKSLNFLKKPAQLVQIVFLIFITHILTKLRLTLSHLRDHKFRHCFEDTLNPLCDCCNDTETTTHFFLLCASFHTPRQTLFNIIRNINEQILFHGEDKSIQTFLYCNSKRNLTVNRLILSTKIEYLSSTERFKCPLLM